MSAATSSLTLTPHLTSNHDHVRGDFQPPAILRHALGRDMGGWGLALGRRLPTASLHPAVDAALFRRVAAVDGSSNDTVLREVIQRTLTALPLPDGKIDGCMRAWDELSIALGGAGDDGAVDPRYVSLFI